MYVHFMMEMGDLVRYYLEANSVCGYNFNKTSSIVNEGIYMDSHKFYSLNIKGKNAPIPTVLSYS